MLGLPAFQENGKLQKSIICDAAKEVVGHVLSPDGVYSPKDAQFERSAGAGQARHKAANCDL
jgi:hypothetical protein